MSVTHVYLDGKLELRKEIPLCTAARFMDQGIHQFKYEESTDGKTRFLTCMNNECEFELELIFEITTRPYTVKRERPLKIDIKT